MARLALPSGAFRDVQTYLKQKRATGRRVSPTEESSAWGAYWDSMYRMRTEGERLGLEKERIDIRKKQFAEQMEAQKSAATISGITQLAGTAAIGAYALKGTELGSKIGLAATEGGSAGLSAAPVTAGAGFSALSAYSGPAALAFGGGLLAGHIPLGSGAKTEQLKGAAVGAGIGGYMMAGTLLGGPIGAVVSGVLGLVGVSIGGGK
ncbi:hypothetical protein KAX02_03025 [candidate division WOR-3 bacterium]|nr:hypothetical protein [candidate division WOR-3 bacterium]